MSTNTVVPSRVKRLIVACAVTLGVTAAGACAVTTLAHETTVTHPRFLGDGGGNSVSDGDSWTGG